MIYLREHLTVLPATPRHVDELVALMRDQLLPADERLGARLVGAFLCHQENWGQVVHLTEHDDLAAFDAFRARAAQDADRVSARERLSQLAPTQRSELLEPVGPVPPQTLHATIDASQQEPVGGYTFAELELAPGKAAQFAQVLAAARDDYPIVAALRGIAGNPRMVFDLWKGTLARGGYQPADDKQMAFFGPLREMAPLERVVHLYPLPYSPLQ